MIYKFLLATSLLLGLGFATGCTDTTAIGGDLVDGSQLPLDYSDSIPVDLVTQFADSNKVSFNTLASTGLAAVGCLETVESGTVNARLGMELVERSSRRLDLAEIVIDSAVLVLPLRTQSQVGDTTATVSLRVLRAAPSTIRQVESITATPLLDDGRVYGELTAVPPRRRSVVSTYLADSVRRDTVTPQLRIALNQSFVDDIRGALQRNSPTDSVSNDSAFVAVFSGLIVEGAACGRTMPTVSFAGADAAQLGVSIYYTVDGEQRQYWLSTRRAQNATYVAGYGEARVEYVHDFGNSVAGRLLAGDAALSDSVAVLKSLDGTLIRVEFPDLSSFAGRKGVTYAELEVPVLPGSTGLITPVSNILIKVANDSGDPINYTAIPGAVAGTPFSPREGGSLLRIPDPNGGLDSIFAYRFNITTLFQSIVTGARTPVLFLAANGQSALPGQSVLAGSKASPYRARIKVASAVLP